MISIIIPTFNGKRFILRCLRSIYLQKKISDASFEVIVIDNGSADKTVNEVSKHFGKKKNFKLISLPQNRGASFARNLGVQNSSGNILLFLDNDTTIEPCWQKKIVDFFSTHQKVGLIQLKLLKKNTNKFDYAGDYMGPFGFLVERARSAVDRGQFNIPEAIFSGKSASMAMPRKVFQILQGFDESYRIFLEDTDLAWRVWLSGFEVWFFPFIKVFHAYGTKEKTSEYYKKIEVFKLGSRNTLLTLFKNLELSNLWWKLPLNTACWVTLALTSICTGSLEKGTQILLGVLSAYLMFPSIISKRRVIQSKRKIKDTELFKRVGKTMSVSYYLGKAVSYIRGKPY